MPRFFLPPEAFSASHVTLTGEDALHISRSLRMAKGDTLILSDGEGKEYLARLSLFTDHTVTADILEERESRCEPPYRVHLYQAYPKGDKLENVIMKATELGVSSVTPFLSAFCVKRPSGDKEEKLLIRHNRIALEAAKQCGRGRLPRVNAPLSFSEMLKTASQAAPVLFCYEGEGTRPLSQVLREMPAQPTVLSVVIGSEGGFSEKEATEARNAGCLMTGLGNRILRAETAPLYVLSALSFAYEK